MSCGTDKLLVTIRVKVELTLELVDELKPRAAKGSDPPFRSKSPATSRTGSTTPP